jgi:trehalose 6-phosphate synthase
MRLALRFVVPLLLALTAIAYAVLPLVDRLTLHWFVRDLDTRSQLVARSIEENVVESTRIASTGRLVRLFTAITQDERLFALAYCAPGAAQPIATANFPADLPCDALGPYTVGGEHVKDSVHGLLHITAIPLSAPDGQAAGHLVLVHDMSFIQRRSAETRRYVFYFFIALGVAISFITVVIAQLSWRGWIHGVRALLRADQQPADRAATPVLPEFRPLEKDLRALIAEIQSEYRPRDEDQITWNPDALRGILKEALHGEEILVVSNREPYIHVYDGEAIRVQRPASGLVTALEPIVRACSGTWIAHGGGSADRATVDTEDRVAVPPHHPAYCLRRIWLTPEEEAGYYYGFANEGLWPLCHIAHVRPTFRSADWAHYVAVNRRFADAVCAESKVKDPIVLVQDYHFALLPRMIRERLPDATVITFWHIPWPNPESFAVCPWQAEILEGLLGSSILGFHTRFHCNNFLDSVDRTLEALVDRELSTVRFRGQSTAIKRYPISIEWPPEALAEVPPPEMCHATVRQRHGLAPDTFIGVGVDRMDYTKGILERMMGIERLLELQPEWVGRFTFVQIAAPTRTTIEEYQNHERRLRTLVDGINQRFGRDGWCPIVLKIEHHEPAAVYEYYRAANVCVITSLHDGMNLVAKEFIAARSDEQGVVVLSRFTGAARELPEALVINPYDIDQCALALHAALTMSPSEQRHRMHLMRGLIREFNVYRWAGRMLLDAAEMRQRERIRAISEISGMEL